MAVDPLSPAPNLGEMIEPLASAPASRASVSQQAPAAAWRRSRLGVDAAMLAAAAFAAQVGAHAAGFSPTPVGWLVLFSLFVIGLSALRGAYTWRIKLQSIDDLWAVIATTALAGMALLSLRVLAGDDSAVSDESLRLWVFATVYVGAGRIALGWSQIKARREGELLKPTLIIGAGKVGKLTAQRLLDHPEFGLRPVGFLDKDPLNVVSGVPVLGASWDLEDVARLHGVQHVVVTFSTAPSAVLLRLVRRCDELGIDISFVPRLYERMSERLTVESVGGLPLLAAYRPNPKGWQFALKYTIDRLVAAMLLILVSPLLLLVAAAVAFETGSPILFRQRRVGLDGREFEMLKFRTMRGSPAEGEADADWLEQQLGHDAPRAAAVGLEDRRTRLGHVLRTLSLDELPQLVNVLRGEMSLVGPRPERTAYVRRFEESIYRYCDRHRVKSGITGWSQVHGLRGQTSLTDRIEWDNYYIENWSLWLDFKILLMTLFAAAAPPRQAG